MVAMPYILVNIVLDALSLLFFSLTSAALLSRSAFATSWLPPALRQRRAAAFVAYALMLALVLIAAARVMGGFRSLYVLSVPIYDVFLSIGAVNSMVLIYQAMSKRWLLNTPALQRRLLLTIMSVVMTFVPVIAVVIAVFGLFVIR
jgi:hypothetical protein